MPTAREPDGDQLLPRELRRHRKARGFNQTGLAARMTQLGLPTSQNAISYYETGTHIVPDDALAMLERVLELDGELWDAKRRDANQRVERTVVRALQPAGANLDDGDHAFPGYLARPLSPVSPAGTPVTGITDHRPLLGGRTVQIRAIRPRRPDPQWPTPYVAALTSWEGAARERAA